MHGDPHRKKTVVTAAHCIKGSTFTFVVDNGESIGAASVHKHPQYSYDGGPYDIAVVLLSKPPAVPSLPIATASGPTAGMPIVLIGYGVTYCEETTSGLSCTSDSNVKRRATNTVEKVGNTEFSFAGTGSTCKGDSGGPAFATIGGREVQIGVTSRGKMPCGNEAVDTRVDVFADWISQVAGGDVNTGQDTTPPTVTIDSPADGAQLTAGAATVEASVSDDSADPVTAELWVDGKQEATTSQPPYRFSTTLTEGNHDLKVVAKDSSGNTAEDAVGVAVIAPSLPSEPSEPAAGAFGAKCDSPDDCDSGLCAQDTALGRSYCTDTCTPLSGSCPADSACMPTGGADHVCALPDDANSLDGADAGTRLVGGCAVAIAPGATVPDATLLSFLLVALAALSRRRRTR